jgi:hypothetical protein
MRRTLAWTLASILAVALPAFATRTVQAAQAKTTALVNVNTASESDLEALPGIGPATAKKIIAGRPYASVADLSKAGVPKSTIDKITSMVTVGTAPAAAPAAKPASSATASTNSPAGGTATTPQQPPVKGMVWVNLSSKVYHREGDRYYGNTKNGKFMTEADAIKAGYKEAKTSTSKAKP